MKKTFTLIALLVLLGASILSSCKKEEVSMVQIRLENKSRYNFDSVLLAFGSGGENTFSDLPAKSQSSYQWYDHGYHYGYIRITLGEKQYGLTPVDYVGESTLEAGKYTCKIDLDLSIPNQPLITFELVKD
jgi:hypothetical protein